MQDRIGRDGSLIAGTLPGKQEHASQQQRQARPATLPATAPVLPPIAEAQLQQLVNIVADSRHALTHLSSVIHSQLAPISYAQTSSPQSLYSCEIAARYWRWGATSQSSATAQDAQAQPMTYFPHRGRSLLTVKVAVAQRDCLG